EKPAHIVRRGVQTSLGAAVKAVAEGKSQGVVSCANTGAFMALSKIYLKTFKGVLRPAIPAFIPTRRGHTLMLDLGANVECSAHMLLQFALMGSIYVKTCLGTENPTVGILNIGEEEMKGTEAVQDAAQLFREHPKINYVGFIEGDKITQGLVDVIITDGFTGNVALKTLEGTAHFITQLLTQVFQSSWQTKLAYKLCEKALGQVAQTMDKRSYNGAPFLGISGVAIKSHGSSDRKGFANAISVAIDMVENQLPVHLEQQFKMDT
ncbi:MAG: phosphate acyltransferase PlsX, partial [Alphaproteobacteria bacterium]|nr:phosphate acyltransferase PlsX [Alphaproteobacteria bacterium]